MRSMESGSTSRAYATAEECFERNLVVEAEGVPPGTFLPAESLLVAHLLTHGLSHHGQAPEAYPAFQLIADLQDLGFGQPEESQWPGNRLPGSQAMSVEKRFRQ